MQCYNGKSCPSYNDRDILLEEVGWGFAMVQICRVKLIPFAGSQMNPAKPFFFKKKKKKKINVGNLSKEEHFGLAFSW